MRLKNLFGNLGINRDSRYSRASGLFRRHGIFEGRVIGFEERVVCLFEKHLSQRERFVGSFGLVFVYMWTFSRVRDALANVFLATSGAVGA